MDLRLRMLTDNSALCLYRLQSSSQLLLRLRGDWYPNPQERIPTPAQRNAKTALRALASRVSAKGNRIEAFPDLPKSAPQWEGRVSVRTPRKREEQPAYAKYLVNQRTIGIIPQIFMTSVLSNRGRHDDKSVATAAAVLYHKQSEWGHTECTLGVKLTQTDIEVEALRPALLLLRDFIEDTNYAGPVHLITGSPTAPCLFLDFTQPSTQHISLEFARKIDSLLSEHPQISLIIQYAKRNPALVGFKRTHHLALEAVKRPLTNEQRPPSIHYQRAATQAAAIGAWEQRYQESSRQSQAYNSALVTPPDGRVHPILRIASKGLPRKGHNFSHHVPHEVQSTLTRLITGHAFIGAY
jgi:hypothetical protein